MDPLTLIGLVTGVGGTVMKGLPMIALVGGGLMLMTGHGDTLGDWGKSALDGIADLSESLFGEDNPLAEIIHKFTGRASQGELDAGIDAKNVDTGNTVINEKSGDASSIMKESLEKATSFRYSSPLAYNGADVIDNMLDNGFYMEGKDEEYTRQILSDYWTEAVKEGGGADKSKELFQQKVINNKDIKFDRTQSSNEQDIEDIINPTVYENDEHMDSEANKQAIIQGLKERGVYRTNPDGTRSEVSDEELSKIIDRASEEERGGVNLFWIGPRIFENSYDTNAEELEAKTKALMNELEAEGIHLEEITAGEPEPEYEELSSGEEALQEKNEAARERANEKPEVNPEPEYEELSSGDEALQEKNEAAHDRANEKPAASPEPEYKELSSEDKALQEKNNAAHERANVAQEATTAQKSEEKSGPVDVGSGKEVESVKNRVVHTQADTKNVVKEDVVESVIEKEKPKGKEEKAEEKEKAPSLKDVAGKVSSDIAKKSGQYTGKDTAGSMNDLIGNATKLAGKKSVEVAIDVAKKQLAYGEPENTQMR